MWVTIVLLILPVSLLTHRFDTPNLLSFFGQFFYPPFWFLQALLIFYFLGYYLIKSYSTRKIVITFLVLSAAYTICYVTCVDLSIYSTEDAPFGYFVSVMTFVFGIFLAKNNSRISYKGITDTLFLHWQFLLSMGINI